MHRSPHLTRLKHFTNNLNAWHQMFKSKKIYIIAYVSNTKDTYNQTQIIWIVIFVFFHIFQKLTICLFWKFDILQKWKFLRSWNKMLINLLCFDLEQHPSNWAPLPSQFSKYENKMVTHYLSALYYLQYLQRHLKIKKKVKWNNVKV